MTMNCQYSYSAAVAEEGLTGSSIPAAEEQQWMLQYLPLVKQVVRQLTIQATQAFDRDDMEQIGLMGLLESLRRYGAPDDNFPAFARLRIRGAILDELRRQDWRPRQVRQASHKLRDSVRELTRQLGREPSEAEVQKHTGLSVEEYHEFCTAEAGEAMESLDELMQVRGDHISDGGATVEQQQINERTLVQVLSKLQERERLILTLYYQHELSLKEIALVLELTDARVCQLCKQALAKAARHLRNSDSHF